MLYLRHGTPWVDVAAITLLERNGLIEHLGDNPFAPYLGRRDVLSAYAITGKGFDAMDEATRP